MLRFARRRTAFLSFPYPLSASVSPSASNRNEKCRVALNNQAALTAAEENEEEEVAFKVTVAQFLF